MKGVIAALFLCATCVCHGQSAMPPKIPQPGETTRNAASNPTLERKRSLFAKRVREEGGVLYTIATGHVIRVVNAQKRLPPDFADSFRNSMRVALHLPVVPVQVEQGDAIALAKEETRREGTALAVVVVDDLTSPGFLVAPEDRWAIVNVAKLAEDNPSLDVLKVRTTKECWRAMGYLLGASDSIRQPCLMRPIHSLTDLDSEAIAVVTPEPFNKMALNATKLNISRQKMVTYKQACEEGWAPAPTNDIQKAIWDKVHKLPTEPIKIEPETKKVKE